MEVNFFKGEFRLGLRKVKFSTYTDFTLRFDTWDFESNTHVKFLSYIGEITTDWEREFRIQLDFVQAKNTKKDALECYNVLTKICTNIIENPNEMRIRTIKERGKTIQKVLQCQGGPELIHRFSNKKVTNFEAVFEFKDIPPAVPSIIEKYIEVVTNQLLVPNVKEQERLHKEKILRDIEEDRVDRLERIERQKRLLHPS